MAMGKRRREAQQKLWVETEELPDSPGHPFYKKLNEILDEHQFDDFAEEVCAKFYAETMGRPSLPPGVYFRLILIGYFESIDSERGIAWRVADSISLREFLGLGLTDRTPNHSTISRTRRLLDWEAHSHLFCWVLQLLAKSDLLVGKTLCVDGTTLEANAAMRSIQRRDTGESYEEFLTRLAEAAGIEEPTREDLERFDRKREGKKTSNRDWTNPNDPDATIGKMKDGRVRMAHKVEHAVDADTGAVVGLKVHSADCGDTKSLEGTLEEARGMLEDVMEDPEAAEKLSHELFSELVADKGYHSNAVLLEQENANLRTYIAEPARGRRNWKGKEAEKKAVYKNRRRIRGDRGRRLQRKRAECERTFAHCYDRGNLRRMHLRGHDNIVKRLLAHVMGANLGLLMRSLHGCGAPRALQGLFSVSPGLWRLSWRPFSPSRRLRAMFWRQNPGDAIFFAAWAARSKFLGLA